MLIKFPKFGRIGLEGDMGALNVFILSETFWSVRM